MNAKPFDLSILIVSYNSRRDLAELLPRLGAQLHALNAEVIVVDNASQDGSARFVRDKHPEVRLVCSPLNLGFAAANNVGARHARGRYLLLLNPDARPERGAIAAGILQMDLHPRVGIASGRLRNEAGEDQPAARMFPSLLNELFVLSGLAHRFPRSRLFGRADRSWADPERAATVDWVPGAFAFIRAGAFAAVGGFDERFFLYYEEVDLCRRFRRRGLATAYWPELAALHVGGVSARTVSGERFSSSGAQLSLWRMRSGMLYWRKHHGLFGAWAARALESVWHRLRACKNRAGAPDKAADSRTTVALLARAWNDTLGGRVSPPRPW